MESKNVAIHGGVWNFFGITQFIFLIKLEVITDQCSAFNLFKKLGIHGDTCTVELEAGYYSLK